MRMWIRTRARGSRHAPLEKFDKNDAIWCILGSKKRCYESKNEQFRIINKQQQKYSPYFLQNINLNMRVNTKWNLLSF